MLKLRHLLVCAGMAAALVLSGAAFGDNMLRDGHPDRYVVQKGDTLWDISGKFLRDPWRWPEIWHVNPDIANPHLIYPGDELELSYLDGKPRLGLKRGDRVVKLSPRVRATPWDGTIPTIPVDAIAPFLDQSHVLGEGDSDALPYIVSFPDEHIIGGSGQRAYVRKIDTEDVEKFVIVRPGGPYMDADSGEVLGYEALYMGDAQLLTTGDPARVRISVSKQEINVGDRLLPAADDRVVQDFYPKPPQGQVDGSILKVLGGVNQIGRHQVVVLDRGSADGVSPGTVLKVFQKGENIKDPVEKPLSKTVQLPDEEAGLAMVFRSFDRVSFALIMEAMAPINVYDRVRNP